MVGVNPVIGIKESNILSGRLMDAIVTRDASLFILLEEVFDTSMPAFYVADNGSGFVCASVIDNNNLVPFKILGKNRTDCTRKIFRSVVSCDYNGKEWVSAVLKCHRIQNLAAIYQ
jgi:hypothetical protein